MALSSSNHKSSRGGGTCPPGPVLGQGETNTDAKYLQPPGPCGIMEGQDSSLLSACGSSEIGGKAGAFLKGMSITSQLLRLTVDVTNKIA